MSFFLLFHIISESSSDSKETKEIVNAESLKKRQIKKSSIIIGIIVGWGSL